MALAVVEILLEKYFVKKIHTISLFNFFLILFLGSVSLLGDEGIWFKLQPCFTGLGMGFFIFLQKIRGKSIFLDMLEGQKTDHIPDFLFPMLETHIALLFSLYGLFMAYVAFNLSTSWWAFYKTIGFYITFAVFFIFEIIYIRFQMKKHRQL